jgi:hypothetical protein
MQISSFKLQIKLYTEFKPSLEFRGKNPSPGSGGADVEAISVSCADLEQVINKLEAAALSELRTLADVQKLENQQL